MKETGLVVWVVTDENGGAGSVCSTLDRAMIIAQEHNTVPAQSDDGDGFIWEPCYWTPVPIDGQTSMDMIYWELRRVRDPEHLAARIRAHIVDEFVSDQY